jgi:hypothetical protein
MRQRPTDDPRDAVRTALDLDAVIDDRPENCLDVAIESSARALLVSSKPLDALGPGLAKHHVSVKASTAEALDELVEMDREKRGGVVRTIMRLFGKS